MFCFLYEKFNKNIKTLKIKNNLKLSNILITLNLPK